MEKPSIFYLVFISVLTIGVQCHGKRPAMQSRPVDIRQRPLLPSVLQYVNQTQLQTMINNYNNLTDANKNIWTRIVLHAGQFNTSQTRSGPVGVSPELYRRYMNMSDLYRRVWFDLLHSGNILSGRVSNIAAAVSPLVTPSSRRRQDNMADASRKRQRTQDYARSRPGTLQIQEPVEVLSSSDDGSSESEKEIDLALRMYNPPNRGKNKMTENPSQHFKKPADYPVDKGSAGTSRQPNAAIGTSSGRSGPGLALAINENSDNPRVSQQALRRNNVSNADDLAPEGFLTLGINDKSKYTRK